MISCHPVIESSHLISLQEKKKKKCILFVCFWLLFRRRCFASPLSVALCLSYHSIMLWRIVPVAAHYYSPPPPPPSQPHRIISLHHISHFSHTYQSTNQPPVGLVVCRCNYFFVSLSLMCCCCLHVVCVVRALSLFLCPVRTHPLLSFLSLCFTFH